VAREGALTGCGNADLSHHDSAACRRYNAGAHREIPGCRQRVFVTSQKDNPVKAIIGLSCLGLLVAMPATAEDMDMKSMDHMKMDHMNMDMGTTSPESSPSSKAFEAANEKMHKDMTMSFTGDTDVDFVTGMIPHHQGAIDMAKVELQYGKDPEIRKLAEDVIKAQESEIAFMNAWLAKHANK
jgi:hypothetical protein